LAICPKGRWSPKKGTSCRRLPQTKILENGTSTHTLAKYLAKARPTRSSVFQNLHFMLPKRFWKTEQRVGRDFSRYFAMVCRFGLRIVAKCLEKSRPTSCSVFQNRRLGRIHLRFINCEPQIVVEISDVFVQRPVCVKKGG